MKKNATIGATVLTVLMISFGVVVAQENKAGEEETKSVGWYVAHIQEARAQNKVCYDNPGLKETPNCQNSLHALQISFVGNN